jgi:hypothetical protein
MMVTNLRLPGQYERLLRSLGLQGPYYNWNRWYLPGVGGVSGVGPARLEGAVQRRLTKLRLAGQLGGAVFGGGEVWS